MYGACSEEGEGNVIQWKMKEKMNVCLCHRNKGADGQGTVLFTFHSFVRGGRK